jgi:hypothetical protein
MRLSLIIPCYNEEKNIARFLKESKTILSDVEYELIFINDGSTDNTILELKKIQKEGSTNITIINFSRNFGKEAAIYAGLQHASGDYIILIDADLQQPISVAKEMYNFLEKNPDYDAVAAYQDERKENKIISLFKTCFYKLINKISDVEFFKNASDFRCLRKNVVRAVLSMSEYHRFSKGIFAWVGFNTYYIPYQVQKRTAGTTSWSFKKLFNYALEGIISFSIKPLRMITYLGVISSALAILYMLVTIIQKIVLGNPVPGYPTIVVLILLLGSIQLFSLGLIGEYIAKIHIEAKKRPIYIAKNIITKVESSEETNPFSSSYINDKTT